MGGWVGDHAPPAPLSTLPGATPPPPAVLSRLKIGMRPMQKTFAPVPAAPMIMCHMMLDGCLYVILVLIIFIIIFGIPKLISDAD